MREKTGWKHPVFLCANGMRRIRFALWMEIYPRVCYNGLQMNEGMR
ncbi:hypothetical protein HMPREF3293_01468 [Christensenella minuta]|uniref:Uncharacterized protein n=1 Tax=Christensenella minuta TaxID=626937 RepID=A0A136Q5B9_9FIRM|nr:hypothetical protein HMPREF3293_01468 [Christensenella minuta]